MKGWRRVIQTRRASATSGWCCSVASSVFFMAEPEAVKPAADRRAVNRDIVDLLQFQAELVKRQIAQAATDPRLQASQLAGMPQIALAFGRKRARLAAKLDHVVDEFRRNTEMTRRLTVAMPLIDKPNNARP
jgi:hypothetical protein